MKFFLLSAFPFRIGTFGLRPVVLLAALTMSSFDPLLGQVATSDQGVKQDTLSSEIIVARRKVASESPDLEEDAKAAIDQIYQQAAAELERAKKWEAEAAFFAKRAEEAPAKAERLKSQLEAASSKQRFKAPDDVDLETLETLLTDARRALSEARAKLNAAQAEPKRRAVRQAELPNELANVTANLEQAEADLTQPFDLAAADPLATAQRTLLEAEALALRNQMEAYRSELTMLAATAEIPALEIDVAAAPIAPLAAAVERLSDKVQRTRTLEGEDELEAARSKAAAAPELLQGVLKQNVEFLERDLELTQKRSTLEEALARDTELRDHWRRTMDRTKANIEAVGLWETIAWDMRSQRRLLPDTQRYRNEPRSRRDEIRELQYERLKLYDLDVELADVGDEVQALLAGSDDRTSTDEQIEVRFAAKEAYEEQARIVSDLQATYENYFQLVTQLDTVQREIAAESAEYAQFIDERVLWIRSSAPLFGESRQRVSESLAHWTNAASWRALGTAVWSELKRHPFAYALGFATFLLWFYYHHRLRMRIGAIGRMVRNNPTVPLRRSIEAFFLTIVVSIFSPGLIFLLSWRLGIAAGGDALPMAVADGLFLASCACLFLEVPRRICRGNGIADAHFLWPKEATVRLRNVMRISLAVLVPAAFVIGATESMSGRTRDDVVGRAVFVLAMLFTAVMAWRLFQPRSPIVQALVRRSPEGWLARLRNFLFIPGVALALALGGLAAAGLYHAAMELTWRAALSLSLWFGLIVAYGLGLRWLVAARVRLARARLLRQRAAERALEPATAADNGDDPTASAAEDAPSGPDEVMEEIDSATIKTQSQSVILALLVIAGTVGMWWIWSEVFPALGALRHVTVGDTSLAHIALAVLTAIFAYVASRNLPGLLEVSVLQQLPIDAGARYAVTTICRYSIVIAAVVVISWLVGFQWSRIQWLVAAMLVGLGFGLQEIFANFVSGLIILLERPIRPGDWITIGGTDGKVTKINMRATTVLDWDRKELIVPNKEIVTGQVVNWSLSENTLRVLIHVGIAYGSDTELATEILKRITAEHPKVLDKPRPKVIFRQFGDSALIFEVRVFIPHLDFWPRVMHEMHMNIDREFRAAGIVIAFPQRDLHVKSVEAAFPVHADAVDVQQDAKRGNDSQESG